MTHIFRKLQLVIAKLRQTAPPTYTNIHNYTHRVKIFFRFFIPSWNIRPLLTFKGFKNSRGPVWCPASICAPPLRDASQSRVLHTNSIFRKGSFLLCTWSRHGVAVASRSIAFARIFSRSAYLRIFFFEGVRPRIGRGADLSRGACCARPRGPVRPYHGRKFNKSRLLNIRQHGRTVEATRRATRERAAM